MSLGPVIGACFCSLDSVVFPWFFVILVALYCCLHILRSSHLFQSLQTGFSKESLSPFSLTRDSGWASFWALQVGGPGAWVQFRWACFLATSLAPRCPGASLGWVWSPGPWEQTWILSPRGQVESLGLQGLAWCWLSLGQAWCEAGHPLQSFSPWKCPGKGISPSTMLCGLVGEVLQIKWNCPSCPPQGIFSHFCTPPKCHNLSPGFWSSHEGILFSWLVFLWGHEGWSLLFCHLVDITPAYTASYLNLTEVYNAV